MHTPYFKIMWIDYWKLRLRITLIALCEMVLHPLITPNSNVLCRLYNFILYPVHSSSVPTSHTFVQHHQLQGSNVVFLGSRISCHCLPGQTLELIKLHSFIILLISCTDLLTSYSESDFQDILSPKKLGSSLLPSLSLYRVILGNCSVLFWLGHGS